MRGAGEVGRWAPALTLALAVAGLAGCGGGTGEVTKPPEEAVEAEVEPAAESAASQPQSSEPHRTPIEVPYGETAEHTLAGGECQLLELELEADRYVELEVEQLGIDVATHLVPPGGGEVARFDSPTGSSGRELVAFVTERPGRHTLEICPYLRDAAESPYRLRLSAPRPPADRDRTLARGMGKYAQARALAPKDPDTAAVALGEALGAFEEARAATQCGWAHWRLGRLAEGSADLETAERHYAEAAAIHRELGESRQAAYALTFLGTLLGDQFRWEGARDVHRRSVELAEVGDDRALLARTLKNLALAHEHLGETLPAMELHRRRRSLAIELGDAAEEWEAVSRLGKVYRSSGDAEWAQEIFEEALDFARRHDLEAGIRTTLQDLGRVHLDREQPSRALAYFERALERKGSSTQDAERSAILNNLGRCYRRLGEREKALDAFGRALAALPPGSVDRAPIFVNVASLHILEGDFEAAEEPSERALTLYRQAGTPVFVTGALKSLAEVRAAQGRLREADSLLAELVGIVETRRSRSALQKLRATFLEAKHFYYEFYAEVLLRLQERHPGEGYEARAFEMAERAKARTLLDELAGTEADIVASADPEIASRRVELELQMSKLEGELLEARTGGSGEEAARGMQDRLRDLEAEHALVTARIFADYPGWSALLESEPAALETIRRKLLTDGDTRLVSFLLADERSHAWIVSRDSLEVVALPGRERIEHLAREAADLLKRSGQPHLRVQARLAAESLGRELLAPLVGHLDGRKLLLVKDGALHYVPFAALPVPSGGETDGSGTDLLVERFELVDLPSASAAVRLRERRPSGRSAAGEVAVLADPVFEPTDERFQGAGRLPVPTKAGAGPDPGALSRTTRSLGLGELRRLGGTLEEARRISSLVPRERRLVALGFDANRDLLLGGRLADYRILHLAGHGLAHPDLTGLVLSRYDPEGRLVDGFIRPYELYGAELPAELVVLSACSTGLGTEVRGEGLLGLSRGFLYAGASQVLASLWDVDDRATAELMERFYTALLRDGDPPARALRKAQSSLRREPAWAAPHYWAGFVLQGDGS